MFLSQLGSRPTRLPSEEARERLLKLHGEMMGVAGGGSGGGQRVAAGAVGAGLEEGGEEEGVADGECVWLSGELGIVRRVAGRSGLVASLIVVASYITSHIHDVARRGRCSGQPCVRCGL